MDEIAPISEFSYDFTLLMRVRGVPDGSGSRIKRQNVDIWRIPANHKHERSCGYVYVYQTMSHHLQRLDDNYGLHSILLYELLPIPD